MDENYYASPEEFDRMPERSEGLPVFVKGWCIVDLVFCSLRGLMVPLSILGLMVTPADNPLHRTVVFEILTGLGIAAFGLTGNTLLLLRKPSAIVLCWFAAASTVASILVGLWQGAIQFTSADLAGPMLMAAIVGVVIVLAIRITLLVFYCMALLRARTYFERIAHLDPRQPAGWQ